MRGRPKNRIRLMCSVYFGIPYQKLIKLKKHQLEQIENCKSEEAMRLLLGVSRKGETHMPKNKGYDPSSKNELPGGSYRHTQMFDPYRGEGDPTIGGKAGSATRKEGVSGAIGRALDASGFSEGGTEELRAYTPQEAQKAQAAVDAQTMREQTQGVKGATPSYKTGGVVAKTGLAMVHKGETIIPAGANGDVEPYRVIPADAGWLACPKNTGQYTGENKPWRR